MTPRTAAGREAIDRHDDAADVCGYTNRTMLEDILAIEAEASAVPGALREALNEVWRAAHPDAAQYVAERLFEDAETPAFAAWMSATEALIEALPQLPTDELVRVAQTVGHIVNSYSE